MKPIFFSVFIILLFPLWTVPATARAEEPAPGEEAVEEAVVVEKPVEFVFPAGLDPEAYSIPEDNTVTPEKTELGRMLFFDPRLSSTHTISCSSCHNPKTGYADPVNYSYGINGEMPSRHTPTLINAGFRKFLNWDGSASSLEEQLRTHIPAEKVMGQSLEEMEKEIAAVEGYGPYFEKAFGDKGITLDRILKALATFERTILSGDSPWDRYVAGDETALSQEAVNGFGLFTGKAQCVKCHHGSNLTDESFHNTGIGMWAENPDLGRFDVSGEKEDRGAFKTPELRDLQKTAPYMHDGSIATIEDVVAYYDYGGEYNPSMDEKMKTLNLTEEEKANLVAFLKSLEGDVKPVKKPPLPGWDYV